MKKTLNYLAWFLISLMVMLGVFHLTGFRINLTESIPTGIYRITSSTITKNSYILFCPDKRDAFKKAKLRDYISPGFCPNGSGYLMKKVVAMEGDIVSSTRQGVFVNGSLLPFSKPKTKDALMRALPLWRILNYHLKEDELLAMTDQSEWSFDARYYGPIKTAQVKAVITPIWVKRRK